MFCINPYLCHSERSEESLKWRLIAVKPLQKGSFVGMLTGQPQNNFALSGILRPSASPGAAPQMQAE
jgi:hypothetical protein